MYTRVLLLPLFAVFLTSCESYRERYFTGEIKTATAEYQLVRKKAPEGSSRTTPTTAEWNYYPEGVSRILAIRRTQNRFRLRPVRSQISLSKRFHCRQCGHLIIPHNRLKQQQKISMA